MFQPNSTELTLHGLLETCSTMLEKSLNELREAQQQLLKQPGDVGKYKSPEAISVRPEIKLPNGVSLNLTQLNTALEENTRRLTTVQSMKDNKEVLPGDINHLLKLPVFAHIPGAEDILKSYLAERASTPAFSLTP